MARHRTLTASATLVMLACVLAPPAARAEAEHPELALRYGAGNDQERIALGLRLGPLWSTDWGRWQASLRPELELSRFRYTGPAAGPDSLNQAGAIGLLHLHYGEGGFRPYVEAGLGVALFSRERLGDTNLSTRFQFSQVLAVGVEWRGHGFAGLRYSHYSNGGIEKPNDGIDLHQFVIGAHF